jgi:uncharacterized protein with GYD domain
MERYLMLFKFTDKGIGAVKESPQRAQAFKEAAAKAGATVEFQLWTTGEFDGALLLSAPNGNVAGALALGLGRLGNVRTTLLRAFNAEEFGQLAAKSTF